MANALADHEQRVLAVVESVIGALVAEGRAELSVTPPSKNHGALIEVSPTREDACPVTIHCEAPGDLDLYVGRHELTTHIWHTRAWNRGNYAALENELREWLSALVAGRYEEEVRLTKRGKLGRGRGVIQLHGEPYRFMQIEIWTFGRRKPWQKISYSPY